MIENLIVKYGDTLATKIDSLKIPRHKTKKALINSKPSKVKMQQKDSFMVMQDVNSQLYCESVIDELIHLTDESDGMKEKAREVLDKLNLFEQLTKGKTVLMIAHRLSSIIDADKICYLADGEIKESGNHEELLNEKGKYFDLFEEYKSAFSWSNERGQY